METTEPKLTPPEISAIVNLVSAPLAWIAFRFARHDKKVAEYDSTRRALTALKQDLHVISDWVEPYRRLTAEEYKTLEGGRFFKSWRNPQRTIFKFNYDAVRGIRQNPPTTNFDTELLSDLSLLDHAITNFFSLQERYERLVQGDSVLARRVILKLHQAESDPSIKFTHEESELLTLSFSLNYQLHTKGIGAEEAADRNFPGLHWAHKKTQESVSRVETVLKKPAFFSFQHRFFVVGDLLALIFLFSAVSLIGSALFHSQYGIIPLFFWFFLGSPPCGLN
jgi:hypothetical protein